MRYLVFLFLLLTTPLRAEVIDLSKYTSLRGAYLLPQPDTEFVTVQLLLNVGEADFDGPEGLAHYLEHLVWASADKAHKGAAKERITNAWTNTIFTNYWNSGDPKTLNDMLAASALVFGPINVGASYAFQERGIVEREFDLNKSDNSGRLLQSKMMKTLLPGHGLSRSIIGSRDSIRQITPEMARVFKETWYHANNARMLITGPVRPGDVIPLLKKHLGDLSIADIPPHPWKEPIEWDGRTVTTTVEHSKINEPFFRLHFMTPSPADMTLEAIDHSLGLLGDILNSSSKSSPRKALYYDDFILSFIEVSAWRDQAGSLNLVFHGAPDEDVAVEDAIAGTRDFFHGLISIPQADFDLVAQPTIDALTRKKDYAGFERDVAFKGLIARGAPYTSRTYINGLKAVNLTQIDRLLKAFQTNNISAAGIAYPKEQQ